MNLSEEERLLLFNCNIQFSKALFFSSLCGDYSQLVESGAIATPGMKPRARRFESDIFALGMYPSCFNLFNLALVLHIRITIKDPSGIPPAVPGGFGRELVFQVKKEFLKASCC